MRRRNPLLEEIIAASIAMGALCVFITLAFWLITGMSPWPAVILAELAGFAFGVQLLALTAPRRR